MVSPASRRSAVAHLVGQGVSKQRACRVAGISRTTTRRAPTERNPDLRDRVLALARKYPRFGFRRIHSLLPGVNLKAVHRIWKLLGLNLKLRRRTRLKVAKQPQPPITAPNQVWSADFCHQRLENGRTVRILAVMDCFTRENLLLQARSSYPASQAARDMEWLFLVHGMPEKLVTDNGPEFRALHLACEVQRAFIQPGKPWQNGYIESFFGKLRDELLNTEIFDKGSVLQECLNNFHDYYNKERPHLSLKGLTPEDFKSQYFERTKATANI